MKNGRIKKDDNETFLYGKRGFTTRNITGIQLLSQIRFDYSYLGVRCRGRTCDSKFLHRHFINDNVDIIYVNGNIVYIDIY